MGLELELLPSQLPPIRTVAAAASLGDGGDNAVIDGFSTPTLAASVLPAPLVCPPAPRKPRPAPAARIRKLQRRGHRCGPAALRPAPVRWIISVPQDVLAAVFVARPAASVPCPTTSPPASKKIRVHVVG
ncbi:hypothetical protein GQ55_1G055500 [Panicum hallii var. hallii]|uniref:Uncharacterized protein n=2 Tax=Panicum hallii TaxID=206008 RepID=A0A2T7F2L6_9POAL|nr:hypothetical protein PAHAL_1G056200 [Panicum hallii]PUZ74322.1 hypothetical protein GQ55_1G055500 [Panicum hallii var. hallii]